MFSLIWIQTVWHSESVPERIVWKSYFEKSKQMAKIQEKLSSMQSQVIGTMSEIHKFAKFATIA